MLDDFTGHSDRCANNPTRPTTRVDRYRGINARAESHTGLFKTELIHPDGPWRDCDHVEIETLNLVHWCNNDRPYAAIDNLTPKQAEDVHYAARNRLTQTG